MEAAACNDSLNSREGAAELLGIDRTRLARIELGSLNPYPEEVLLMSDAYNAPELNNYFCSKMCPIGKATIPTAELLHLDRLTIRILTAHGGQVMKYFRKTTTLIIATAIVFTGKITLDLNARGQETQTTSSAVEPVHIQQLEPIPTIAAMTITPYPTPEPEPEPEPVEDPEPQVRI